MRLLPNHTNKFLIFVFLLSIKRVVFAEESVNLPIIYNKVNVHDKPVEKNINPYFINFHYDHGFLIPGDNPNKNLQTSFFGSRSYGASLLICRQIASSNFAGAIGLEFSSNTLDFEKYDTGDEYIDGVNTKVDKYKSMIYSSDRDSISIRKAKDCLAANSNKIKIKSSSLDFDVAYISGHIMFFSNKFNQNEGFMFSLGLKAGIPFNSVYNISYVEDNTIKSQHIKDSSHIKAVFWGGDVKISWRFIGLKYELIANDIYKPGKGPKMSLLNKVSLFFSIF